MRGDRSAASSRRMTLIALYAIVFSVVVLQRFAVPVGGAPVSVSLLIVLATFAFLLLSGALVEDRVRAGLYLVGTALCLLSATASFIYGNGTASFTSIVLLVILYAPFAFVLRPGLLDLYPKILEFFCKLMVFGAVLAVGQFVGQRAGWQYSDLLGNVVPPQFLFQDYNTSYTIQFGSDMWKSNGVFFLEPSFCSQFLALAIIAQLIQGGKRWRLPLYAAGLLATVSGTGLLLLGFGLTVLAWRRGALWSIGLLLTTIAATVAVASSPAGNIFAERAAEARDADSSVSLRFTDPYMRAYRNLGDETDAPLVGHGPGFVEEEAAVYQEWTDLALAFPPIPKLATEYGIAAAVFFSAFMIVAFVARTPSATLSAGLLFMHLTLSGSLLQPQTVYLAFVLASVFATIVPLRRFDPVPVPALRAQRAST